MTAATITFKRRDPAVVAGRAHHVLDAAARMHAQWPAEGRDAIGEAFVGLGTALEEYRTAVDEEGDVELAAETAAWAMALLLAAIAAFLGKAVADEMLKDAAEAAR